MKHKLIIFVIVLSYFVSISGGLATLLETEPNSADVAPITVAATGPKIVKPIGPTPVGPPRGGATTNGESWGG